MSDRSDLVQRAGIRFAMPQSDQDYRQRDEKDEPSGSRCLLLVVLDSHDRGTGLATALKHLFQGIDLFKRLRRPIDNVGQGAL